MMHPLAHIYTGYDGFSHSSGGSLYQYGAPRRVRKARWPLFPNRPWIVTNHPAGTMTFATWREAMDYATSAYVLMNAAVA